MPLLYHPESCSAWPDAGSIPFDNAQGVCPAEPGNLPAGQHVSLAAGRSTVLPSLDFETYSDAGFTLTAAGKIKGVGSQGKGGLPVVGSAVYAEHPSTEVLVAQYDLKDGAGMRKWTPEMPPPQPLFDHIAAGGMLAAWNIGGFEWMVWNACCTRRYGWPPLPLEQCVCDMAKARRYGLPGQLEAAAAVMGGAQKDKAGKALIQKLTRPRTPTKNRPAPRWTRETAPDDFAAFDSYCADDVRAEEGVAALTPDLSPFEREVWLTDQRINARGVQVDVAGLDNCLAILSQAESRYTRELQQLTGGAVGSVSEVAKFSDWLATQGVVVPNMQAETLQHLIKSTDGPARRALEIREILGSANVKKLRALRLQTSRDGRLRGQYQYCGAVATGRFSAGGVQLQNLTGKGPAMGECESCGGLFGWRDGGGPCPRCGAPDWQTRPRGEWSVEGAEQALQDIATRDLDHVTRVWRDPVTVLCGCLRALLTARPGYDLVCVDYTAIEAVVLACLARCQWRIDTFASGRSIYLESASRITGVPYEQYEQHAAENGTHHPDRNKLGKVMELACGFSGWIGAAKNFGADKHLTDDEIKDAIIAWRDASPEIVELWGGQYRRTHPTRWEWRHDLHGLEGAAIQAVMFPGQTFQLPQCEVAYVVHDDVLWCVLPSGRRLYYHRPRLTAGDDRMGRGPSYTLSVEQWNSNPAKGPMGWHRVELWVGVLVENVVQAVARDLLAGALVRCDGSGYPIVMHTHDEGTAEVPQGVGSVEGMAAIFAQRPAWASWWPIKAEGGRHTRYQKF